MKILETFQETSWTDDHSLESKERAVEGLEQGKILFFPQLTFSLLSQEEKFLSPAYVIPQAKNISFNPLTSIVKGAKVNEKEHTELLQFLKRYYESALQLVTKLFPSYVDHLQIGRTSLRPVEISGRVSSYRKDDTRLHVDAFPANPNQGRRILRVFTNVNPLGQERVWRVGEPFEQVAARFYPLVKKSKIHSSLLKLLKITKGYRTEYDHIMLQLHDLMKADRVYQASVAQEEIRFPAKTSWIVQTDHVSHAAMQGQHILEQTFYLPAHAMQNPAYSPVAILEKLAGKPLI